MQVRVVLDASIFASALMKHDSPPSQVLKTILDGEKYELVLSQSILDELQRILFYPKVRKRIQKTDEELARFVHAVSICAHLINARYKYEVLVPDDPEDDIYLIAALESRAEFLVTGDNHLLRLQKVEGIKILTAREFLTSV